MPSSFKYHLLIPAVPLSNASAFVDSWTIPSDMQHYDHPSLGKTFSPLLDICINSFLAPLGTLPGSTCIFNFYKNLKNGGLFHLFREKDGNSNCTSYQYHNSWILVKLTTEGLFLHQCSDSLTKQTILGIKMTILIALRTSLGKGLYHIPVVTTTCIEWQ